jgi:CRP-like cAMP-binding protein
MTNSKISDIVANNDFFSGLSEEHLEFLLQHSKEQRFGAGEIIFRQGDHADRFYLVLRGEVTVEIPAIYGPPMQMQNLGRGKILGWSWLITPYRWDFQARAVQDSEVVRFDGGVVLRRCEKDAEFGYEIMKRFSLLMSERLTAARKSMIEQWMPSGFA